MSRWAYVYNNIVEESHYNLPECWRNVSNLYLLENDLATLASLGWYPVVDTTQPLSNQETQTYGPVTLEFDSVNSVVTQIQPIVELAVPNVTITFDILRSIFMQNLRQQRNNLIAQSDWVQLPDVQQLHANDTKWQTDWQAYRQALRDLPELYDSQYPDVTNSDQISWPVTPGAN